MRLSLEATSTKWGMLKMEGKKKRVREWPAVNSLMATTVQSTPAICLAPHVYYMLHEFIVYRFNVTSSMRVFLPISHMSKVRFRDVRWLSGEGQVSKCTRTVRLKASLSS